MAEHVSLISLAAWLLHQSEQARASSDFAGEEYGARASLETAARLAQAAQVVKDAADRDSSKRTRSRGHSWQTEPGVNRAGRHLQEKECELK